MNDEVSLEGTSLDEYNRYYGYSGWDEYHPQPEPKATKGTMKRWQKIWDEMEKPEPMIPPWTRREDDE